MFAVVVECYLWPSPICFHTHSYLLCFFRTCVARWKTFLFECRFYPNGSQLPNPAIISITIWRMLPPGALVLPPGAFSVNSTNQIRVYCAKPLLICPICKRPALKCHLVRICLAQFQPIVFSRWADWTYTRSRHKD